MKRNLFTSLLASLLLFSMCSKKTGSQDPEKEIDLPRYELLGVPHQLNDAFGGYYIGLPPQYSSTTDSFPLLLFLHGLGQMGNGQDHLPYLLYDGIGKLLKDNRFPTSFNNNGSKTSFLVVSPQFSIQPTIDEVMQVLDHITSIYRVDNRRVYLSGLSLGARITTLVAAAYPYRFAAIVPIAGVAITSGMQDRCKRMTDAKLPVWEFHNNEDMLADVNDAKRFIGFLSGSNSMTQVKMTIFDAFGHDAWTKALDTLYKEDGKNMYEWMLQFSR